MTSIRWADQTCNFTVGCLLTSVERMADVLDKLKRRKAPDNCWMGVTVEGANC